MDPTSPLYGIDLKEETRPLSKSIDDTFDGFPSTDSFNTNNMNGNLTDTTVDCSDVYLKNEVNNFKYLLDSKGSIVLFDQYLTTLHLDISCEKCVSILFDRIRHCYY